MRLLFVLSISVALLSNSLGVVFAASTEIQVKKIVHRVVGGGQESVDIQLSGENDPNIFQIDGKKPRLVIDFLNAGYSGNNIIRVAKSVQGMVVRSIRVGRHSKPKFKTRVVLDLTTNDFTWNRENNISSNILTINLNSKHLGKVDPKPVVLVADSKKIKPKVSPSEKNAKSQPEQVQKTDVKQAQGKHDLIPAKQVTSQKENSGKKVASKENSALEVTPTVSKDKPTKIAPVQSSVSVLLDLSFDKAGEKEGEMVLLKLSDFHPPIVSAVEKGSPKIVCEFPDTKIDPKVKESIQANGKFVESIEVVKSTDAGVIRVELNLKAGKDYDLQQVFFKEDNLFVLIVNTLGPEWDTTVDQ